MSGWRWGLGTDAGWILQVGEQMSDLLLSPTDAPGQYGAYFYDDGFLALPSHVFSRR